MTDGSLNPPLAAIKIIVQIALDEDAAVHDRTSALLPENATLEGAIVARDRTVIAGIDALEMAFGPSVRRSLLVQDGDMVNAGTEVATVGGSARAILSAERVAINVLGMLSGIATLTRKYVDRLALESSTRILDTRKTTPGLRLLEKYAVRCGGGHNHRMTLAEMIFIKDNHIAAAGSLKKLLAGKTGDDYVIIEVDQLKDLKKVLALQPDRVLLDNLSDAEIAEAIKQIAGKAEVEVSGSITLERVPILSKLGVDYISVGALTHSAPTADFSLEVS